MLAMYHGNVVDWTHRIDSQQHIYVWNPCGCRYEPIYLEEHTPLQFFSFNRTHYNARLCAMWYTDPFLAPFQCDVSLMAVAVCDISRNEKIVFDSEVVMRACITDNTHQGLVATQPPQEEDWN